MNINFRFHRIGSIFTPLLFLAGGSFSQDSIWVTGSIPVKIPKPKPEIVVIHDTIVVYVHDTINVCPQDNGRLKLSEWPGSFQSFIDSAKVAVIDAPVGATGIHIRKSMRVVGTPQGAITNTGAELFIMYAGTKIEIDSLTITQGAAGTAFYRQIITGKTWTDSISNTNVNGGRYTYLSSRGGKRDSLAVTTFTNCILKNSTMNIQVYSQDGPFRALHLRNAQLSTDTTHNIYLHPSVAVNFDSVVSIKAGKLALHYYSGGVDSLYHTAAYFKLNRVSSLDRDMWEMVTPKGGIVEVHNSDLAPYTTSGVAFPNVYSTNTRWSNWGNGIDITGRIVNCSGEVWSKGNKLIVDGGTFSNANLRNGGTMALTNVSITGQMYIAEYAGYFIINANNCTAPYINDLRNSEGNVYWSGTPVPANNARPGVIVATKKVD